MHQLLASLSCLTSKPIVCFVPVFNKARIDSKIFERFSKDQKSVILCHQKYFWDAVNVAEDQLIVDFMIQNGWKSFSPVLSHERKF